MRRTQMHLEPSLAEALDRLAHRRGTSRAEVMREAARRFVAAEEPEEDPIWRIVDIAKGMDLPPDAPTDAAERHDHYLAELQVKQMEEFRKRRR